jgi:hypothetical protein
METTLFDAFARHAFNLTVDSICLKIFVSGIHEQAQTNGADPGVLLKLTHDTRMQVDLAHSEPNYWNNKHVLITEDKAYYLVTYMNDATPFPLAV